jgi:hypothetical protein
MDAEDLETVLDTPVPEEQDDLAAENEPDLMANEQTWPTEEELMEAEGTYHILRRHGIVEMFIILTHTHHTMFN